MILLTECEMNVRLVHGKGGQPCFSRAGHFKGLKLFIVADDSQEINLCVESVAPGHDETSQCSGPGSLEAKVCHAVGTTLG